jgi:flagellar motor switch protein FliM
MRAYLAQTTITVNELIRLKPGDIIQTAKQADSELLLQAEDRSKFAGRLYQYKGARAIRITRLAEVDETL